MKKLGFGFMRLPLLNPSDDTSIDLEQVKKMVDVFMQKGFTYFDTAWMYCGFQSENMIKSAVVERYPREDFTVATKLHAGFFNSLEDCDHVFQEQQRKTGVAYFDYYLLHGITAAQYPKFEKVGCFDWLVKKKEQGLVKHIGFSFHDSAELLDRILTEHPEMEFVQLQLNYLDWNSEWIQSRKCYETAVKHGVSVIVMEPVKGGTLANVPEEVEALFQEYDAEKSVSSWAIRFAASLDNVMMVLSGMSNVEQVVDNTGYMEDFQPFCPEEEALVQKAADIINAKIAVPCTGCSYCTAGCPKHIAIPQYFSLYNEEMRETAEKQWTANKDSYGRLSQTFGKAGECIGCRRCEGICPQHLPIVEHLKAVAGHFEK